jgi:hypothetical protein
MYIWYPPKAASPSLRSLFPYSRGTSSIRSSISRGTYALRSSLTIDSSGKSFVGERETRFTKISEFQEKLREKWPEILAEAKKLEKLYPDPIQGMVSLLGELPGDYQIWREIIEEPYG